MDVAGVVAIRDQITTRQQDNATRPDIVSDHV